jgi:hypothetical protein
MDSDNDDWAKLNDAKRYQEMLDDVMRQIIEENPKASAKQCEQLFLQKCLNSPTLNEAALHLEARRLRGEITKASSN